MEISELSNLVSLSMSYQAYVQELNADNVMLAGSGQRTSLESTFADLLTRVDIASTSSEQWRSVLVGNTVVTSDAMPLDEISIAIEKSAGSYSGISEGYNRVLNLYRTSLGRG